MSKAKILMPGMNASQLATAPHWFGVNREKLS
jgi:hypothetical protein